VLYVERLFFNQRNRLLSLECLAMASATCHSYSSFLDDAVNLSEFKNLVGRMFRTHNKKALHKASCARPFIVAIYLKLIIPHVEPLVVIVVVSPFLTAKALLGKSSLATTYFFGRAQTCSFFAFIVHKLSR